MSVSVPTKALKRTDFDPKVRCTVDKKCEFTETVKKIKLWAVEPGGKISMPLCCFHPYLFDLGLECLPPFVAHPPQPFTLPFAWLPHQYGVFDEAMTKLRLNRGLLLALHTGWGKTKLASAIALAMGGVTVIVNQSVLVQEVWKKEIHDVVEMKSDNIDYSTSTATTFVVGVETLKNMDRLLLPRNVRLLIVDECKLLMTVQRLTAMMKLKPLYCLGLSADVRRPDGMDGALPMFFGPRDQWIVRRYSAPFTMIQYRTMAVPEIIIKELAPGKMGMDWHIAHSSVCLDNKFQRLVCAFAKAISWGKIIIACRYKKQAVSLFVGLCSLGESCTVLSGDLKQHPDARIVIAVIAKAGVGYDLSSVCVGWDHRTFDTCILASDMVEGLEQLVGRAMRASERKLLIIDFVHAHPKFVEHGQVRKEWAESLEGCTFRIDQAWMD
jgi:hypothetical protein